jgi:hypothetical protein
MSCISRLDNRKCGRNLIWLLALLLALAIPVPLLLAGDDYHDHNNDREHARFVDPIVGSWIIHVTVDTPQSSNFDNIAAFWGDGITTSSDPTDGASYGVWKKMAPNTYFTKLVEINADTTFTTITATTVLTGDTMMGSFQGKVTDSTGKQVFAQFTGRVKDNRITSQSTP